MSFVVDAKVGDQRALVMAPKTGQSRRGATVNLENPRLTNDDTANDSKNVITAHEDGDPFHFQINSGPGVDPSDGPDAFQVTVTCDGSPGSGVSDLTDPGLITWISPDAASLGPVVATAEDIP